MLRRIARVLRVLVFGAGLSLLLWLPLSFYFFVGLFTPLSSTTSVGGGVRFVYYPSAFSWSCSYGQRPPEFKGHPAVFFPQVLQWPEGVYVLDIPLWLLAFLCLAWPVTSFIIHRRRHKRGFPVVQPELSCQKSELSPMSDAPKVDGAKSLISALSEAPKVRPEREPGASPRVGGGA